MVRNTVVRVLSLLEVAWLLLDKSGVGRQLFTGVCISVTLLMFNHDVIFEV